jgi:N-acetylneuraminic acid mutarotase
MKQLFRVLVEATLLITLVLADPSISSAEKVKLLSWEELPSLPDKLGVAGPFAGVHNDALIVAGGANFPRPVWDTEKVWQSRIHVLIKTDDGYVWQDAGTLARPVAYGAVVSTPDGVVCIGGNDAEETFDYVFLLRWDASARQVTVSDYPALPKPCAFSAATIIDDVIYLAGGQSGQSLDTAMINFWSLDLSKKENPTEFVWQQLEPWPGPSRALNITAHQHNGYNDCVYVISGRRQDGPDAKDVKFLKDVWEYTPATGNWRKRTDVPRPVMGGTGIGSGQSHIFVLGGADGSLFFKGNELKGKHPGFPKEALAYHTITDTWISAGDIPRNHVTTIAVKWNGAIIIPSGEVRPRVRSAKVWSVKPIVPSRDFGVVNYVVLFGYLLAMVGVGVYFTKKNKNTDDFFRGGQSIPWWAAGCSIFATMLSSLTFTGIPSKAFAQDWVYSIGSMMIPVVAVVAVFVAMPFFRRIDCTSAYEYLEERFSRSVRLIGSASFTLFHIFAWQSSCR